MTRDRAKKLIFKIINMGWILHFQEVVPLAAVWASSAVQWLLIFWGGSSKKMERSPADIF